MKTKFVIALFLVASTIALAQTATAPAPDPAPGPGKRVRTYAPEAGGVVMGVPGKQMMFRHELGAWWKNSKVVEKLQLSDYQVKQLEEVFYQHRLKLIDFGAEMEKADMKLRQMLNADTVDESQVNTQVDQVLAARGKMEREFTMLTLNFRKILTPDQWKQLQAIRGEDRMFFHRAVPPGGGPMTLPPGGPQSDLMPPEIDPAGADCQATEKNGMKIVTCTKSLQVITDLEHEL